MKRLIIILIQIAAVALSAAAQNDSVTAIDFRMVELTGRDSKSETNIPAIRVYDFAAQFPYYYIDRHNWKGGEKLQARFKALPSSGYLYAVALDGANHVKTFNPVNLATITFTDSQGSKLIFPGPTSVIVTDSMDLNDACICFWYSPSGPIDNFDMLTRGLTFTTGSLLMRMTGQLGSRLWLPSRAWKIRKEAFRIELPGSQADPRAILPIFIRFSNEKNIPSEMSSSSRKNKKSKNR